METVSENERWIICPVCRKGNPAGTRFCQHCWGAILNPEAEVSSEEMKEATKRRESYLRRKKITRIASITIIALAFLGCVYLFLSTYSDILVKPPQDVNSDPPPGDWSMFRRDLQHTGGIDSTGATPEGIQKWVFSSEATIHSSPAVVDGTVYFGSQDSNLYALDADTGAERWAYKTGSWVESSPSVVNGVVYFGSNDSYLYALDVGSGEEIWNFKTNYPVKAAPAIADGMLYFRSDDYYLYAIDIEKREEVWRFNTNSPSGSSPAISEGIVLIGSGDGYCFALHTRSGQRRLRFKTHYSVSSTPAVHNGETYFATDNGYLWVIDGTARTWLQEHEIRPFWLQMKAMGLPGVPDLPAQSGSLWGIRLARGATASSPLVTDDSVYIGSNNKLIAVDTQKREIRWEFETGGIVRSSPVMAGSAVIVGSEDGRLYAVDSTTGEKLWDFATGGKITSSPAVADGVVYVGSHDGNLYAIE